MYIYLRALICSVEVFNVKPAWASYFKRCNYEQLYHYYCYYYYSFTSVCNVTLRVCAVDVDLLAVANATSHRFWYQLYISVADVIQFEIDYSKGTLICVFHTGLEH